LLCTAPAELKIAQRLAESKTNELAALADRCDELADANRSLESSLQASLSGAMPAGEPRAAPRAPSLFCRGAEQSARPISTDVTMLRSQCEQSASEMNRKLARKDSDTARLLAEQVQATEQANQLAARVEQQVQVGPPARGRAAAAPQAAVSTAGRRWPAAHLVHPHCCRSARAWRTPWRMPRA
jgi:hypothetical protein